MVKLKTLNRRDEPRLVNQIKLPFHGPETRIRLCFIVSD